MAARFVAGLPGASAPRVRALIPIKTGGSKSALLFAQFPPRASLIPEPSGDEGCSLIAGNFDKNKE